jgi:hypothetical protein
MSHHVISLAPYITATVRVFDSATYRLTECSDKPQGQRAVWINVITGEHRDIRNDD